MPFLCLDKQMTLVENILELKKMLVGISTDLLPDQPSGGLDVFSAMEAQDISNYIFIR